MIGWKLQHKHISELVIEENDRANRKFSAFPLADTDKFVRILGEEFGEICEALNKQKDGDAVVKEIVQVMSVCWRFLAGELRDGNI